MRSRLKCFQSKNFNVKDVARSGRKKTFVSFQKIRNYFLFSNNSFKQQLAREHVSLTSSFVSSSSTRIRVFRRLRPGLGSRWRSFEAASSKRRDPSSSQRRRRTPRLRGNGPRVRDDDEAGSAMRPRGGRGGWRELVGLRCTRRRRRRNRVR